MRISKAVLVGSLIAFSGCATTRNDMALTPQTPIPNIPSTSSLVLVVIETSKEGAGLVDWSPIPIVGAIVSGKEGEGRVVPLDVASCNDGKTIHLLSLSLSETLLVRQLKGSGMACSEVTGAPISFFSPKTYRGHFTLDIGASITPILGKIVYAGRIRAHMRDRKSDSEPRASSSMFPLLDQAVTGFYSGTYDITIEDKFDEDIALFRNKFPGLKQQDILKSVAVR